MNRQLDAERNESWHAVKAAQTMKRAQRDRAVNRHIAHTERAQAAAVQIKRWLDDHGEVAPPDVNWAHVGDMGHVADSLEEILDFIRS